MFEEVVLLLDRGEAPALERRTLGMLYGIFHGTFQMSSQLHVMQSISKKSSG